GPILCGSSPACSGIIHRDLKPGNIMIHQSRRPVVLDFGIAKVIGKGSGMTQPGAIVGTPTYMPPEQAGEEPHKIGPHSDVYSLGAILYTLLTGQVPYNEGTPLRTILKVISPESLPPSIRSIRPEIPRALEKIVVRCLTKDIAGRYATAQALADDLKRFKNLQTAQPSATSIRIALPTVVLTARGGKQVRLFNPCTTIGRAQECELVLKSSEVSKRHCRILLTPDHVIVEDLASVNGTNVNGQAIKRVKLHDGDELDVAGHVFQVKVLPPGS